MQRDKLEDVLWKLTDRQITVDMALDAVDAYTQALLQQANVMQAQSAETSAPSADVVEILEWLLGYSDFPERKPGDGAYWWRKELRHRLEHLGIFIGADGA